MSPLPDPDLHEELAEEFQSYSSKCQIFISTYSPDFLNEIPLENIYYLKKKKNGFASITHAVKNELAKSLYQAGDKAGLLWRQGLFA